ncbi:hypothetical protein EDB89DRAFT_1175354 [Lactarius sanguifluus]|nr:hypothetical protein EDB89DRAFT_1175354 [Lactarius sanguifluus]
MPEDALGGLLFVLYPLFALLLRAVLGSASPYQISFESASLVRCFPQYNVHYTLKPEVLSLNQSVPTYIRGMGCFYHRASTSITAMVSHIAEGLSLHYWYVLVTSACADIVMHFGQCLLQDHAPPSLSPIPFPPSLIPRLVDLGAK